MQYLPRYSTGCFAESAVFAEFAVVEEVFFLRFPRFSLKSVLGGGANLTPSPSPNRSLRLTLERGAYSTPPFEKVCFLAQMA
jgi:hypothetical protein